MSLAPISSALGDCEALGFRFGDRGTHTSRTMMLDELQATLADAPEEPPVLRTSRPSSSTTAWASQHRPPACSRRNV